MRRVRQSNRDTTKPENKNHVTFDYGGFAGGRISETLVVCRMLVCCGFEEPLKFAFIYQRPGEMGFFGTRGGVRQAGSGVIRRSKSAPPKITVVSFRFVVCSVGHKDGRVAPAPDDATFQRVCMLQCYVMWVHDEYKYVR